MSEAVTKHAVALQTLSYIPEGGITQADAEAKGLAPADAFLLIRVLYGQADAVYAMSAYDGHTGGELAFGAKLALWLAFTSHLCGLTVSDDTERKLHRLLCFVFALFTQGPTGSTTPDPTASSPPSQLS